MNNKNPKVSVVIPAYNEEKYLPACLESFKNQTFRDYELIVVDNNSTDKTADVAKSFGARVVKETVQGMIPARERGFREAKAEIIARTDADTAVPSNWLEIIYETFQENPQAVALMGTLKTPHKLLPDHWFKLSTKFAMVTMGKLFTGHTFLIGPNMALKKSVWEKIKVHVDDKLVHEDMDLACHLAEKGEILFVPHLPVPYSLRRMTNNPIKGISQFFGEYPIRYFRTIILHNPRFKLFESKTKELKRILRKNNLADLKRRLSVIRESL